MPPWTAYPRTSRAGPQDKKIGLSLLSRSSSLLDPAPLARVAVPETGAAAAAGGIRPTPRAATEARAVAQLAIVRVPVDAAAAVDEVDGAASVVDGVDAEAG